MKTNEGQYGSSVKTPICYNCKYMERIPGDAHISCTNLEANVDANSHGVKNGWFFWPFNFDPIWLTSCDGFEEKEDSTNGK